MTLSFLPGANKQSALSPQLIINPYGAHDWSMPEPRKGQSEDARRKVEEIKALFRRASDTRKLIERDWVLSTAMIEGRQWLAWDDTVNKIINLIDDAQKERYITDNLIRPLAMKWVALVTQTKPDASVAPMTNAENDRAAAACGRSILAHLSRRLGQQQQNIEIAYWMFITGLCYQYSYWDPNAMADIPIMGPDGQVQGRKREKVGDHQVCVKSPFEIFVDPGSRTWEKARYVIDMTMEPLTWFVETFGKAGEYVQQDNNTTYQSYLGFFQSYGGMSQLPAQGSPSSQTSNVAMAPRICYYEAPGPYYTKGRWIIIGGDRLLWDKPWAPEWLEDSPRRPFPMFTRYALEELPGHPYSRGMIPDVAPLQVAYNRQLSRVVERLDQDKLTVVIDANAGVQVDAWVDDGIVEGRNVRKILQRPGSAPIQMMGAPPVSVDTWRLKESIWLDMQTIVGIHDVQMGNAPPGVTAGIAIEALQQNDRTQLALPLSAMEAGLEDTANIAILSYRFNNNPYMLRLMGLDDTGNPGQARMDVQSFLALSQNGACAVEVKSGSATPKTPAGKNTEILTYLKLGLFGPPNTPQAAAIAVNLMSLSRSDLVLDMLNKQIQEQQQLAAQQMQLQQQQLNVQQQIAQQNNQAMMQIQSDRANSAVHAAGVNQETKLAAVQMKAGSDILLQTQKAEDDAKQAVLEASLAPPPKETKK